MLITKSNFDNVKKRVKQVRYDLFKGFISHESALSSIMTYSNCFIHSNNRKALNMIVVDKDGNVTRVEGNCEYTLLVMKYLITKIVMENIC